MVVYRLCNAAFALALDGKGAEKYGGRWNAKGVPVVYTSSSRSLAILELLVNLSKPMIPDSYVMMEIALPDDSHEILDDKVLSREWRRYPAHHSTIERGSAWVTSNKSLSLAVPSCIVPEEKNVLINPNRDDIAKVKVLTASSFVLDERLFTAW